MRKLISLGIAGLLTLVAVATWGATHQRTTTKPRAEMTGAMDPYDMMKKAKDLPVHTITDAF
jgi:hypothetical protein